MNKRSLLFLLYPVVVLLVALLFFVLGQKSRPNYKYVRSGDLIYGYLGTKEVQVKYEAQLSDGKGSLDTLKADFEASQVRLQEALRQGNLADVSAMEQELANKRHNVLQYEAYLEQSAAEAEEEMMKGVLAQINSFSKTYCQERGWEMLFGTTQQGSLLYGEERLDVTEELLAALNENYHGN